MRNKTINRKDFIRGSLAGGDDLNSDGESFARGVCQPCEMRKTRQT